ncbi:MAG: hypothetical protein D4R96_02480 [Nitrosopumilaceae archaeon]|nr:MAG: hypothetical protein D4R96_02480 [Nitrosopumilaceae archaeon]
MVTKTVVSIIVAFLIAISISSLFLFFSVYQIQNGRILQKGDAYGVQNFLLEYDHNVHNKKAIFIIGSSQVRALNTTYIDEYLSSHNSTFRVYNLSIGSDRPQERIKSLQMILQAKPHLVAYGIGPRDFQDITVSSTKPISILPDPETLFHRFLSLSTNYFGLDLSFMDSPNAVTLAVIKEITGTSESAQYVPYPDAFFKIGKPQTEIHNNEQLLSDIPHAIPITHIDETNNENEIAFVKIINQLQANNIKTVIFVVPEARTYLNKMPESYQASFNSTIAKIEQSCGIDVYRLDEKYADQNIFFDPNHLAINKNVTIYSKNVSQIILSGVR